MRTVFFLLLINLLGTSLIAQGPGRGGERPQLTLSGQVVDESSQQGLEFATISLFSKRDSSVAGGGLTDMDGKFSIQVPAGPMYAVVEFIGYEATTIDPLPIEREAIRAGTRTFDLGVIRLSNSNINLEEVTVQAERSETSFSLDKRVFTVGKDLANRGGSVVDILDNVPSVTVDIEGAVSLRGSQGVRILIDGRPSRLTSADNGNALRQIPANTIESIEVITNPSSRYAAEGTAGIINIITKKEKRSGFNGSVDLSGGYYPNAGVGVNLNYRKGKVNWFASYGLNYRDNPGTGFTFQRLDRQENTLFTDQKWSSERSSLGHNVRGGIDFFLSEKEVITGALRYQNSEDDNHAEIQYRDYINDFPNNLSESSLRIDDEIENESGLQYSLNYRKEYSSRRHFLDIGVQYEDDLENEGSDFSQAFDFPNNPGNNYTLFQRTNNDEGVRRWLFNMDFKRPLGKDHQYEFGLRSSLREITNDYLVEELRNDVWTNLTNISNDFVYDEDIHSAYGQYGNKITDKLSFQLGLRTEYSHVITNLKQTNEVNDRDYINLFPSAFLNYQFNEGNGLQANYSRRIRRPRFWDLNPFFTYQNPRNFRSGNPNLEPEYTDSYELNYLRIWEKASLTTGVFYRHTTDAIERIQLVDTDSTFIITPQNLATRNDMGFELVSNYNALSWLRINASVNVFRSIFDGTNVEDDFNSDAWTMDGRLMTQLQLWDESDLQIRANYRAPRTTVQGTFKSMTSIDLGWSKDFLPRKNMTITFSLRDLLNARKRRFEIAGLNFTSEGEYQWRQRTFTTTLSYRINQKKQRRRGGGGFEDGGF